MASSQPDHRKQMSPDGGADAGVVVVAFAPELSRLEESVTVLRRQCDVVLVDNSERPELGPALAALAQRTGAFHLTMGGNKGLAAAQNAGIAWLLERGKTYVLLLDDDSLPGPSLVSTLRAADEGLRAAGEPVAAVGARAMAPDGADISNSRRAAGATSPARDMMSSGTLIRADVWRQVGGMEERLFVDCVDFEWGWRAQAKGAKLFLVNDAVITHRLGTGHLSVLGVRLGIPSPIRHYYQFRNVLWMLGRGYVPMTWKLKQLVGFAVKPLIFSFFVKPRAVRFGYMLRGVRDAVAGRGGAFVR